MSSIKVSAKAWNRTAARLAVAVVIALPWLGASWAQEPVQSRIDEEFAKQEKIYHRKGTRSYTVTRGLSNYAELVPTGFCDVLGKLGSSDRWLDIGAASGRPYSTTMHRVTMRLLKSVADPGPKRARSRSLSRIAGRTSGKSRPRALAMTVYGISLANVSANIRSRSLGNSRSSPTSMAVSLTRKICPDSSRGC